MSPEAPTLESDAFGVEQQAYVTAREEPIGRMRVVGSGSRSPG